MIVPRSHNPYVISMAPSIPLRPGRSRLTAAAIGHRDCASVLFLPNPADPN